MYCQECGTQLPEEAMFCPDCGTSTGAASSTPHGSTAEQQYTPGGPTATPQPTAASPTVPARHWHFPFGTIVAAVILVAAFWMLFTNYENRSIRDLKGIIFTQYNVGDSLGKVINENMSHAKWSSEKRGNDSYDVTVTGVENMYDSMIEATFRVTYMDDAVHSVLTRASVNGQVCTDSSELAVVMLLLYGQLDEDTLAGLMLWDSIVIALPL